MNADRQIQNGVREIINRTTRKQKRELPNDLGHLVYPASDEDATTAQPRQRRDGVVGEEEGEVCEALLVRDGCINEVLLDLSAELNRERKRKGVVSENESDRKQTE